MDKYGHPDQIDMMTEGEVRNSLREVVEDLAQRDKELFDAVEQIGDCGEKIRILKRELAEINAACIDYYMENHVSQMRGKTEAEKKLWSIGQEAREARK